MMYEICICMIYVHIFFILNSVTSFFFFVVCLSFHTQILEWRTMRAININLLPKKVFHSVLFNFIPLHIL